MFTDDVAKSAEQKDPEGSGIGPVLATDEICNSLDNSEEGNNEKGRGSSPYMPKASSLESPTGGEAFCVRISIGRG